MLEAYWDAYEAVRLDRYEDVTYLREVWTYHGRMVAAIHNAEFDEGYEALVAHNALLRLDLKYTKRPGVEVPE